MRNEFSFSGNFFVAVTFMVIGTVNIIVTDSVFVGTGFVVLGITYFVYSIVKRRKGARDSAPPPER
jgi:hypothetical protein